MSYSERSTKDRLTDQGFWQFSEKKFEEHWPGPWENYGLGEKASTYASYRFAPLISHTPDYRAAVTDKSQPILVEVQGTGKGAAIPGWKFKTKKMEQLLKWNRIHETTFWLWDNATETSVWTSVSSVQLMIMQGKGTEHLLDGHRQTWAIECDVLREFADTNRLEAAYG